MMKQGDKVSWNAVNGVARGTIVAVSISYLVRLDSGKQVVVNERSIIKGNDSTR